MPASVIEIPAVAADGPPGLSQPLYEGLRDLPVQQQLDTLSSLFHWDPVGEGQSEAAVSLADCLHLVSQPQWPQVVATYWTARRNAALRPLLAQRVQHLRLLGIAAVEFRHRASGADDGLLLHAARTAAEADLADAEVARLETNYRLTVAAGQPVHAAWLTAATAPRAAAPDLPVQDPDEPLLLAYRALLARTAAVLAADELRAAGANDYGRGTLPLADAIRRVEHQAEQSWRLLVMQTRYNRLHADAVLSTRSAGGPETLARRLIGSEPSP